MGGNYRWSMLRSTTTCLFCLFRGPERGLPCGHSVCDECTLIFGHDDPTAPYHFRITTCVLCSGSFCMAIRMLPPTKRPTILALDGGGIRAVIILEFLIALQRICGQGGGRHFLAEVFELAVGTSSGTYYPPKQTGPGANGVASAGALVLPELFMEGTDVTAAVPKFKGLAARIFPPHSRCPIVRLFQLLVGYIKDGSYSAKLLDAVLQEAFKQRRLFDSPKIDISGIRIAMTASRIRRGKLCIFTNYRGQTRDDALSAYEAIVPRPTTDEPFLWEV